MIHHSSWQNMSRSAVAGILAFTALLFFFFLANAANPSSSILLNCAAPAWDGATAYTGGAVVSHTGNDWRAKWWSQGEEPGTTGPDGAWEDLGSCAPGGPTATPTPTSEPPNPADYLVELIQTSSWVGGFGAEFRITNNGDAPIEGWTLECDLDFVIDNLWNANWSQSGGRYTISDLGSNSTIATGQTVTIGLGGTGVLNANSPTNCTLNSLPISVIVDSGDSGDGAGVLIDGVDDNGAVYQLTIDQGLNSFTLTTPSATDAIYSLLTNNSSAISAEIIDTNTLQLTGLTAGRAGLRIEETSTGSLRYIGIRVRTSNGQLPGLPDYVSVGSVSEDSDADLDFWKDFDTDLTNKRMDVRYIYLNGGPVNGWSTWNGAINEPGGRAISFIRQSLKLGMIPSFVYYNIPDGGESYSTNVAHMQSVSYMEGYFNDLQLALDIINEESPDEVVVMIFEPDFLGYLAQYGDDPLTMMARASAAYSSGVLSSTTDPVFPDTVRGLVEAINYTVSTRAPQVQFGWQLNLWASPAGGHVHPVPGNGLIHLTDTMGISAGREAIHAEASAITQYYVDAGIITHGADFLSIDKYGLDAGAEGSAGTNPANSIWFWNNDHWHNYLTFVDAMRDTTDLPVVLWQMPVGHINSSQFPDPYAGGLFPNLSNGSRNYEDSAPTFFLGDTFTPGAGPRFDHFSANDGADPELTVSGAAVSWGSHMDEARDAGVISVLFGAGVGASTDGVGSPPSDDYWWITKVQDYYLNPVPLDTAVPVDGTVTGVATRQGASGHSGIVVTAWDGATEVGSTTTDASGSYSLSLPAGTVTIKVEGPLALDGEKAGVVVVAGEMVTVSAVVLQAGDLDDSDIINIFDLTIIGAQYGNSDAVAGWDARADLTQDGTVDIFDLSIIGSNYGKSSPVEWP